METVCGDMCRESIGLSKEKYSSLVFRTDVVVHAAADVRHYAPDEELYKSNVAGTQHMLRLAEEGKCPFVHMSTVSVAADHLIREPEKEAVFTEACLDIGQNWEDNGYTRTKFQAEELVFDAAKRGVTVKVFRIGRLMPRNSDGMFQKNPDTNAAYRLLRGLKELGKYPEIFDRIPFEITPVDTAAKAVAELLESNKAVSYTHLLPSCTS